MATLDKTKKSSRLLASRRYTHETLTAGQESFTNVLDLQASEIYTQGGYIPSSGLPFSSSADIGAKLVFSWRSWKILLFLPGSSSQSGMYWTKITNPITGRKVNINGTIGKKVIKNYLNQLNSQYLFHNGSANPDFELP